MGWLSILGKVAGIAGAPFTGGASLIPTLIGTGAEIAGHALSAKSQANAQNRGNQFEGQLDLQRLLMERDQQAQSMNIAREQEGRAGQGSAFARLLGAQHVLNPAAHTQLSPYSVAPRQATDAERTGADALSQEVLARLQGGNPIAAPQQSPLTVDPRLLKPGTGENVSGWLGALLSGYGGLANRPRQDPRIMSGIPTGAPRV